MKLKYILIILAGISVLAFSACQELFSNDNVGQSVRFTASVGNERQTKTAYTGKEFDGKELIKWLDNDEVKIYLAWKDKNGSTGIIDADYRVAFKKNINEVSHGTLSAISNALTWQGEVSNNEEYHHSFYSVYPASFGGSLTKTDDVKISFSLPRNPVQAVDMKLAYMAAAADPKYNKSHFGPVVLQYYPMITTLYVTLVNDMNKSVTPGAIVLSSTDKPICGKYTVELKEGEFVFDSASEPNEKTITINEPKVLTSGDSTDIAFFIIPQQYNPSTLSLRINGKEHNFGDNYTSNLVGKYKYNIRVSLSGSTPPTFKETIGPGEAQFLILWITNYLKDGDFNDFFGFDQNGDHRYGAFNDKFINNGGWDSETIAEDFVNFFTEEQLNKFYQRLLSETTFATSNKQITHPIHADFFNLFPQLEKVVIQTHSTIEISNHKNLKTATFQYPDSVTVTNCSSLTTVTIENGTNLTYMEINNCGALTTITAKDMHKLTVLKLINTPYFKEGTFTNVGQTVHVTLNNCSTGLVDGDKATLNFGGKYTIDERINSSNVTVQ